MFIRKIVVLLGSLGVLCGVARGGNVLYVDDDAPPAGDGLSWNTAYRFLQDALADAAGGGVAEIRVAQGVYTPAGNVSSCCTPHGGLGCDDGACETAVCAALPTCCVIAWDQVCADLAVDVCDPLCADPRTETFQLLNGVLIAGGYAGVGAPNPDARDIDMYETVLSGDLAGNDGPGPFENNGENSYTVVTGSGTDDSAVLDGVTVSGGNANGPDTGELEWIRGAGMWNLTGSPTVSNCTFWANHAQVAGAGMYNREGSSPDVTNCTFEGNVASDGHGGGMLNNFGSDATVTFCAFINNVSGARGGGMHTRESNPTVSDCTFSGNAAVFSGGGMQNWTAGTVVTNCLFSGNSVDEAETPSFGGGMTNGLQSTTIVTDCTFTGNTAREGGAMGNQEATPTVTGCDFSDNVAFFGGAVENFTNGDATFTDCTFTNNSALVSAEGTGGRGGGMANRDCQPTVQSCSFIGNTSVRSGGAMRNIGTTMPKVLDCVFINNSVDQAETPSFGGAMSNGDGATTVVTSCTFSGNSAREGGAMGNQEAAPTITNCRFVENTAVFGGAIETGIDSFPLLVNCTIVDNTSDATIGGVYTTDGAGGHSETTILNSIVYGNGGIQISNYAGAITSVEYSDVQGGWPGPGNIDADPLFADADHRLGPGSPCIDAASNPAVPVGITTDLDGNPRFVDDPCRADTGLGDPPIVNMGAYEFQGRSCDLDLGGTVGITDFLDLLAAWGPCPEPCAPSCPADFDGNCTVGVTDFLILLANWG
jgi:hypothetical protein